MLLDSQLRFRLTEASKRLRNSRTCVTSRNFPMLDRITQKGTEWLTVTDSGKYTRIRFYVLRIFRSKSESRSRIYQTRDTRSIFAIIQNKDLYVALCLELGIYLILKFVKPNPEETPLVPNFLCCKSLV